MRYEKKMLILSGSGKGVVLVERSGLGVKFALRTFGLRRRAGLKAGIVTRTRVIVRDLPETDDPSAVFMVDDAELDALHFAVFDKQLVLYGAFGKRMWESNLMDLLFAHCRPVKLPEPAPSILPPIVERQQVLPMPDGTGIPQSRLSVYGDEALSDSDFYTPFELAPRMEQVDGFLDSPRVLNEPFIGAIADGGALGQPSQKTQKPEKPQLAQSEAAATEIEKAEIAAAFSVERAEAVADADEADSEAAAAEYASASDEDAQQPDDKKDRETAGSENTFKAAEHAQAGAEQASFLSVSSDKREPAVATAAKAPDPQAEQSAATDDEILPWECEANYLRSRSSLKPLEHKPKVSAVVPKAKVAHIRETDFLERCARDVDKLFADAPQDGELSKLLPDMEWVKVEFDGGAVSVGRTKLFLCYAVAGLYEKISPLGDEAQWLPKHGSAPTGKGYWLIFQDINTGELIESC